MAMIARKSVSGAHLSIVDDAAQNVSTGSRRPSDFKMKPAQTMGCAGLRGTLQLPDPGCGSGSATGSGVVTGVARLYASIEQKRLSVPSL